MDCNIFPSVVNKSGQTVDSKLFGDLYNHLKDRQLSKKVYLATKTESFKDWFGTKNVDENGEPLLRTLSNGDKAFVNDRGESKSLKAPENKGMEDSLPNKVVTIHNTNYGEETPSEENKVVFNLRDIKVNELESIRNNKSTTVYFHIPSNKAISFGKRASDAIAEMMLSKEGDNVTIAGVALYSPNKNEGDQKRVNEGQGIGKYIYQLVGDKLLKDFGLTLQSDKSRSIGAENVWDYLVSINKAVKLEDGTYQYINEQTTTEQDQNTQEDTFHMMPIVNSKTTPKFNNLKLQKEVLLNMNMDRIAAIKLAKKKPANSAKEIVELNKLEKSLRDRVEQLSEEIRQISSQKVISDIDPIAKSDLARMNSLANSTDFKDLTEAKEICDFYLLTGAANKDDHPIFEREDMFDDDGNSILDYDERMILNNWAKQADDAKNIISAKLEKKVMDSFNQNLSLQRTLGSVDFKDVFGTPMKDASDFDLWFMDATNGVFSHNGAVPQMLRIILDSSMNDALSITVDYEEKIKAAVEAATKIIQNLDGGKYNLKGIGVKGVSWDLFFQRDLDGSKTGKLTSRFSNTWTEAESAMLADVNKKMYAILTNSTASASQKGAAKIAARRKMMDWYRTNTVMVDIQSFPEVMSFINDPNNGFDFLLPHLNATSSPAPNVSGNQYKEIVAQQIELMKQFKYKYESMVEYYLEKDNVITASQLTIDSKLALEIWLHTNSPVSSYNASKDTPTFRTYIKGATTYNIIPEMDYVVKIPRRNQRVRDSQTSTYVFGNKTNFYDQQFEVIDKHQELYDFHQVGEDVLKFLKDVLPAKDQQRLADNQMGLVRKSLAEIFYDPQLTRIQKLSEAGRFLIDKISQFGNTMTQSEVDNSLPDLVTGKKRKEVNKATLVQNTRDIDKYFLMEKTKFYAENTNALPEMTKRVAIIETQLSNENVDHLAQILNAPARLVTKAEKMIFIKKTMNVVNPVRNGKTYAAHIPVGRVLYNYATNKVVEAHSYNLPKALTYYSQLAANYKARNEIKPYYEAAMNYYKQIPKTETQNTGIPLVNKFIKRANKDGLRLNAIRQIEDTHNRVLLGNYEGKHFWKWGQKKYYTREEKRELKRLKEEQVKLIGNVNPQALELSNEIDKRVKELGYHKYVSEMINDTLNIIRLKGLGWNINSSLTNFFEGQIANEIAMAMEIYYPAEHWYKATRITRAARTKALTFGHIASDEAKIVSLYMNRYGVLQDSRNEFQKAGIKTSFSLTQKLDPMLLNQSVEYLNQSPIFVTAMMSEMIEDINGNTSSVWDALDMKTGKLKTEFRSEKNVANWEHMQGAEYDAFKIKLNKTIVDTHGDYDALRGSFAKSNVGGKVLLIFKGWLPRALYNRFAVEQVDIETNRRHKGRYRSHTKSTGGVHGAVAGFAIAGPVGAAVGYGIGFGLAAKLTERSSQLSFIEEQAYVIKLLALKTAGIPINRILRRRLINTGSYKEVVAKFGTSDQFTELDAQNLMGNIADMAMSILWTSGILLAKAIGGALFDGEDEEDDEKPVETALVNRCWSMLEQATVYINPVAMYEMGLVQNPVVRFGQSLYDLAIAINRALFLTDVDTSTTGNRGGSKVVKEFADAFFPSPFKGNFGFDSQIQQQRTPTHINQMFWSDYKKYTQKINADRVRLREKMRETEEFTEKEIKDAVNKQYPTLNSQLKEGRAIYKIDQDEIPDLRKAKKLKDERKKRKDKEILEKRKQKKLENRQ